MRFYRKIWTFTILGILVFYSLCTEEFAHSRIHADECELYSSIPSKLKLQEDCFNEIQRSNLTP